MKKTTGIIIAVAFAAGTLIALPQASAAPSPTVNPASPTSSSTPAVTTKAQAAAVDHWTPARMKAARSADTIVVPLSGKTSPTPAATNDLAPMSLTSIPGALGTPKLPLSLI